MSAPVFFAYATRMLLDGRQAVIVPLLYGRARLCIGPVKSIGYDHGF